MHCSPCRTLLQRRREKVFPRHCGAAVVAVGVLLLVVINCTTADTAVPYDIVPLPDGSRPEGVTAGAHNDLWVACLSGAVVHVDLASNTSRIVHREVGIPFSGVKFDVEQGMLFVAASVTGRGYVLHMRDAAGSTGNGSAPVYELAGREVLQLGPPGLSYINDVALSADTAYFTDSFHALLHAVPRRAPADSRGAHLRRHGTGAHFDTKLGQFRANGAAVYSSTNQSDVLLLANTHTGYLYRVEVWKHNTSSSGQLAKDSSSNVFGSKVKQESSQGLLQGLRSALPGVTAGANDAADTVELRLPRVPGRTSDTLLLDGVWVHNDTFAFVVDNYNDRVWGVQLESGGRAGRLACLLAPPVLGVPTTLASQRGRLWAVNAHLDSCFPFLPCPKHHFELVGLDAATCQPVMVAETGR